MVRQSRRRGRLLTAALVTTLAAADPGLDLRAVPGREVGAAAVNAFDVSAVVSTTTATAVVTSTAQDGQSAGAVATPPPTSVVVATPPPTSVGPVASANPGPCPSSGAAASTTTTVAGLAAGTEAVGRPHKAVAAGGLRGALEGVEDASSWSSSSSSPSLLRRLFAGAGGGLWRQVFGSGEEQASITMIVPREQIDCTAYDPETCLQKPGCRWFAFSGDCPLCEEWFGNQLEVTGCRDWEPGDYCSRTVVGPALEKFRGEPSDRRFKEAVTHYTVEVGSGLPGHLPSKQASCSVWCDKSSPHRCSGMLKTLHPMRGVNYGGRFVPEQYLELWTTKELFAGVPRPGGGPPGLCDLAVPDATARLRNFLVRNVQPAHFAKMAGLGFNLVRLPLGYWSVLDLAGSTPHGSAEDVARWRVMQDVMSVEEWTLWIDRVFLYAQSQGLRVLLDLHSAPGAQVPNNVDTGCAVPFPRFETAFNRALSLEAIAALARLCARHGSSCFGVEMLNEPEGVWQGGTDRTWLRAFYVDAIREARRFLGPDVPLVIMEWAPRLSWWQANGEFTYTEHGVVMFDTHLYPSSNTVSMEEARHMYDGDLEKIGEFHWTSPYQLFVGEYGLSYHDPEDQFDFDSYADWLVHQIERQSAGSIVWNFDSLWPAWGPVDAPKVGKTKVDWPSIWER